MPLCKIISTASYAADIHPRLCNEEPDLLPPITSFSFRPMSIRCVQRRLPSLNICFRGLDPPCPLEDLPEQIQSAIHRYTDIGCDEVITIKLLGLARKSVKATEQKDYAEEAEGEPGGIRLETSFEDELVAANALSAQGIMEFDVRNRDRHPGQDRGDCCKILEPLENGLRAGRTRHVRQQSESGGKPDAVVWNTPDSWV